MKNFQFRLQKVMEATKTREDIKKRELAVAVRALQDSEARLVNLLLRFEEQVADYESATCRRKLMVSDLAIHSRYTERLSREILRQKKMIESLADDVRLHREKLLEITKDKKVLERLKDKKYEEFRKKLRSMEQKFMDEVSVRSFRNGNGNGIAQ